MRDVNLGMRVEILHNVCQEGNGVVTTTGCEGLLLEILGNIWCIHSVSRNSKEAKRESYWVKMIR